MAKKLDISIDLTFEDRSATYLNDIETELEGVIKELTKELEEKS